MRVTAVAGAGPLRPVFADSACVRAPLALVQRGGGWQGARLRVRYGLYRSPALGPVLIDTGYTPQALTAPGRGLGLRLYGALLRPRLHPDGQPAAFLARHGLRPCDITTVIVTHFHADHVAGLRLFGQARLIASGAGWQALQAGRGWANLRHGVFAELLPPDFAARLQRIETCPPVAAPLLAGLTAYDLTGEGALLALPLPGHAAGHVGLIFAAGPRPLLYAVDAQWTAAAAAGPPPRAAAMVADDRRALARSSATVAAFARAGGDVLFCHDPALTGYDDAAAG